MSLSSTTNRVSYTGNGNVDTYSYTFKIFDDDDLLVTVRDTSNAETTLTKTTDYTVTGVGESSGGTVVLVNSAQAWLDVDGDLKSGYILTIRRRLSIKQETDIRNQGPYYAANIEDQFDRQTMVDQQQQDEIDRSLKLPETISAASFDMSLPSDIVASGADKVPMINASGNGFADASTWPSASQISTAEASATAASASAAAALASEGLAAQWAAKFDGSVVNFQDFSSKEWAIGIPTSGSAKDWATKTASAVVGSLYSAKEWALGILTRGVAGGGSSKDWANYTGGTVDDTEYSSKKYAQDSAASAIAAQAFSEACTGLAVYANDAAFVSATGTAQQGDIYFNSTSLKARTFNGTAWVEVGSAAGGGSLEWVSDALAPEPEVSSGIRTFAYEASLTQYLYAMVRVPSGYTSGNQVSLRTTFYSAATSGNALVQSQSTLIRVGTDAITSTTNQRTSTNAAVTLSAGTVNIPQSLTLDLTSSTGQINGVNVSAGDIILIRLTRGTDTSTSKLNIPVYGSEVTYG